MSDNRAKYLSLVLLAGLLLLTALIYKPGLQSGFLLDDHINLLELSFVEEYGYKYFVLDGATSSLGRPLSLFTFALQHEHWSNNPAAFKIVNLVIHLLNGLLVFGLARYLTGKFMPSGRQANIYSLVIVTFWLLHPIQVSTVLYTIQRMAMLSAFFVFAGLAGYLYFREKFDAGEKRRGLIGMSLSVGLGGTLGVLCKENAILLPLIILVTEFIIRPTIFRDRNWQIWASGFLYLPLLMLAVYFSVRFGHTLNSYTHRPFTMAERLLTQPLILMDYLGKILVPRLGEYGLYYDDYKASQSLFSPPATAVAHLFSLILLAGSFILKRHIPLLSLGILLFFVGHSLEASHLSLELYFEHRNYLPMFGAALIIIGVIDLFKDYAGYKPAAIFIALYLMMMLAITFLETNLWSRPLVQAEVWAREHPGSHRAIENLGNAYLNISAYKQAKQAYKRIWDISPNDIYPDLQMMTIEHCLENEVYDESQWKNLYERASNAEMEGLASLVVLDTIVKQKHRGNCDNVDLISLMKLLIILAGNDAFSRAKPLFHELATVLAIKYGDPDAALANINEAIRGGAHPNMYMLKLKILIALDQKREAEETLRELKDKVQSNPTKYMAFASQINKLENEISDLK